MLWLLWCYRSVDEAIRDSSSDSANTSESSKPAESHLVSRSCQTIVTMSQIQDAPLMSDAKIIITEAPAPEMVQEPEDSKDRVFAEADGENSEEGTSMESEIECENFEMNIEIAFFFPIFFQEITTLLSRLLFIMSDTIEVKGPMSVRFVTRPLQPIHILLPIVARTLGSDRSSANCVSVALLTDLLLLNMNALMVQMDRLSSATNVMSVEVALLTRVV